MSDQSNWTAMLLALILAAVWALPNRGQENVTADTVECPAATASNDNCAKTRITGNISVTITPSAAACAMATTTWDPTQETIEGGSLSFVDDDNWRCRLRSNSKDFFDVATIRDGRFSVGLESAKNSWNPVPYNIDRSDGIHVFHHYLLKFHLLNGF